MTSKLKPHFAHGHRPLCNRYLTARTPAEDSFRRDTSGMSLTEDPTLVECKHCRKLMGLGAEPQAPDAEAEAEGDEEMELEE